MANNEKITKFEEALNADKSLAEKYDAALIRIKDNKEAGSVGEAMMKAASELGFDISAEEFERELASVEEIMDDKLDGVVGGEDEYGHSDWCVVPWHCYTAFMHTESDGNSENRDEFELREACWADYVCQYTYHAGHIH